MRWSIPDLCKRLEGYGEDLYDALRRETRDTGVRALIAPIEPFNRSRVLSPIIAAAGVVSFLALSGIAVGAIVTAIVALLAIYYLLTQVFGYEISLAMPGGAN
jgi:hypothetical protein